MNWFKQLVLASVVGGLGATVGCNQILGIDGEVTIGKASGTGGGSQGGCGTDVQSNEELVRGCVMRVSCDPVTPPYSVSDCVTLGAQDLSGRDSCTYGAESCDDIAFCLGRDTNVPAGACTDVTAEWTCDENIAIRCGTTVPYRVDCESLGAFCVEGSESKTSVGGCSPANSEFVCLPGDAGSAFCVGDDLHFCEETGESIESVGYDCSALGDSCVELQEGAAYCGNPVIPCDTPGSATCEDGVAYYCDAANRELASDCEAAGLRCQTTPGGNVTCVEQGCSLQEECEEKCLDDATLQFCQGGHPVTVDCTDLGLLGCGVGQFSSGEQFVACRR